MLVLLDCSYFSSEILPFLEMGQESGEILEARDGFTSLWREHKLWLSPRLTGSEVPTAVRGPLRCSCCLLMTACG